MKKGLLVLVLALLAVFGISATTFEADTVGEGGTSTLAVTLDLKNVDDDKIEIGFTQHQEIETSLDYDFNVLDVTELKLKASGGFATLQDNEKLYAYWIVRSPEKFKASLYVDAPLSTDEGEGDTLDWTISINNNAATIGGEGNYNTTGYTFLNRTSATDGGDYGYVPLVINTDDYTEKTTGIYTGTITIKIEPAEV